MTTHYFLAVADEIRPGVYRVSWREHFVEIEAPCEKEAIKRATLNMACSIAYDLNKDS